MKLISEDMGIKLMENEGKFYLQYDAGTHMIKEKRIEITADEATICQCDAEEMYAVILNYQNNGIYGIDI